jgi:hypothetical protein
MAFYPNLSKIQTKKPIIYICNSALLHFITMVQYLDFSFVLVTGDSDDSMPFDVLSQEQFNAFISNPLLIHWFSQNMTIDHPKITRMPIGLDYHTMCVREIWGPITSPKNQEFLLTSIRKIPFYERFYEKEIKCYANFHFQMNTKYGQDRKNALAQIPTNLVYYEPVIVPRLKSWNTQKDYAFIISPHGGGYDCHRLWEGLILGCIPIVKTSPIDKLYDGLPVLIVNEWSDINQQLLEDTLNKFKTAKFNYNKLLLQYWVDKFSSPPSFL